ncbi:hypothetical protein NL676_023536 [Syzygium grande]|nr:hypothetical protein NL676_023536 [Syzygium grande]
MIFIFSCSIYCSIFCSHNPPQNNPTSLGLVFIIVLSTLLVSSYVGFYSQLTCFCFMTHVLILLASLSGQGFDVYVSDGVGGVGADRHQTQLLGEGIRRVGCREGCGGEEAEHEDHESAGGIEVNMAKIVEVQSKELDERMRFTYGQWVKTDLGRVSIELKLLFARLAISEAPCIVRPLGWPSRAVQRICVGHCFI